jgi:hypothetical protein
MSVWSFMIAKDILYFLSRFIITIVVVIGLLFPCDHTKICLRPDHRTKLHWGLTFSESSASVQH